MREIRAYGRSEAVRADGGEQWPCGWDDCENDAAYAVTFNGQPGHVHDCGPHTAFLREWTDIERVTDLPCPYSHGGLVWTDAPPAL